MLNSHVIVKTKAPTTFPLALTPFIDKNILSSVYNY